MNKKWIIFIITVFIISLIVGFSVYYALTKNEQDIQGTDMTSETKLAENKQDYYINNVNLLETSTIEEGISPNAIIIKKEYFKTCDHLTRTVEDISDELINGNEEDVSNTYSDWKVEEYTPTEITIYKEYEGYCNEHYIVKNHYGVIGIYKINEDGEEVFQEETEISTKYLPESDVELLNEGVKIIGNTNLVEFLEDYE